ncbi:hypothetical protein EFP84_07695 [Leptospira kmetyi]|uniref:Uncharacterized protein n=1 Tax=Leptospira kmetyi TaxID=408139 RepID=A0AAD0XNI3_9LEPT|nr:hypothetical protein EFP84_07695 [Leptospira kmetyi]
MDRDFISIESEIKQKVSIESNYIQKMEYIFKKTTSAPRIFAFVCSFKSKSRFGTSSNRDWIEFRKEF